MVILSDSSLLLEEIAEKAGCLFMSDMHQAQKAKWILTAIRTIPHGAYSVYGWKQAAEYITGQGCTLDSEEEIREYLSTYCRKQESMHYI